MNLFDKICAVLAFVLGALFIILGVVGLVTGCKAHFTLPPVLGFLPALVGWGIVKPICVAWNRPRSKPQPAYPQGQPPSAYPPCQQPIPPTPPEGPSGFYK